MKKLVFFIPIMAVSLLASCGNSSTLIKHTLNATCTNGTVTGNKGEYQENENVALTFTANEGYLLPASIDDITFTGIDKSGVTYTNTTGNLVFKMPAKEVSITVTATMPTPSKYNLIAVCDNGTVTGNKAQYEKNENVELTFTADVGCSLPASIDDIGISGIARSAVTYVSGTGVLTFKMPTNTVSIAVTATEPTPSEYTLSATCTNGTVTGNKGEYQENENVVLTFIANDDYILPTSKDNIIVTGIEKSDITYNGVTGSLTFKMPVGDVTITVTATEKPAPTKNTLTTTCFECTVTGNKGQYEEYEFVTLTFTANPGTSLPMFVDDIEVTGIDKGAITYDYVSGRLSFRMPANNVTIKITASYLEPWYKDETYINSLTSGDIGTIKYIKVNGINHRVRLIGVDHDELTDELGETAHTTWEFVDLLSDSKGYSLATVWDWEMGESSTSQDYLDSNLRKNFTDVGLADLSWYQKGKDTKSTTYKKSVLDMLPQDLKDELKTVKKTVVSDGVLKETNARLFPLSYREMTEASSTSAKEEGSTYAFYKGDGDKDENRIKHQVNWHEEAASSSTLITDGKCSADNYAGYNSSEKEEYGGTYWLRSPYYGDGNNNAWNVYSDGALSKGKVYKNAYAVAPAFCLGEIKWYEDETYINSLTEDDIGTINHIKVNGISQDVRLIDVDHDELADDSGGTAHTTWEFVNLLSDSDGYSLATVWDWTSGEATNQNYFDSNLRKALDGGGNGELSWYQKGSATKSTTYTDPVLSMFPADLQGVIKEVKKPVAIGINEKVYEVQTYNTKVFSLSYQEMTEATSSEAKEEGSTYAFYKGDGDKNGNRIKHQIKHHDGAATTSTPISDGMCDAENYAGYNPNKSEQGGIYWLRSPNTDFEHWATAWCTIENGELNSSGEPDNNLFPNYYISNYVLAVAPAFCI